MSLSLPTLFIISLWSVVGLIAGLVYGAVLDLGVRNTVLKRRPILLLALAPVRVAVVVTALFLAASWAGLGGLVPAILGFTIGSRVLRPPTPST